jgi:hypothetical protein
LNGPWISWPKPGVKWGY